jgi:hypothetical protein
MKTASPRSTVPPIFRRRALPSPQAAVDRERIRSGQTGHQLLRQRDLRRKTYDLLRTLTAHAYSLRPYSQRGDRRTAAGHRNQVLHPGR